MASNTEICNIALLRLGQPAIMSLSDNSPLAKACALEFTPALEATLRAYPWPFAIVRKHLARLADKPAYGFEFYYELPSDCIRVVDWYTDGLPYQIEGTKVATNSGVVAIRYVSRDVSIETIDSQTVEAIALNLAMRISISITENIELKSMLFQEYNMALQTARNTWAVEDYPREAIEGDWIPAHDGYDAGNQNLKTWNPWGTDGTGISGGNNG